MTDKKNKNKKYTPAVRRGLKRIVRRKLWQGLLVAVVMVMLMTIAALGLLIIVNYNQRSEFDSNVSSVCNGMYRLIKSGEGDQQIREDIEDILAKCNTPGFVSKVYRYDNGVELSGYDAKFEDETDFEDEEQADDMSGADGEMTENVPESEVAQDSSLTDREKDIKLGDTFVENGITYEWASTDEGITAVKVKSDEYIYEDVRSAEEVYRDYVAMGYDDVDYANIDKQYECSREYLDSVFEREGMNNATDHEESILWRGYFYRGRTLTVGENDYYVVSAMYENPFTDPDMKSLKILMYVSPMFFICCVVVLMISYRKKKKEIIADEGRRNLIAAIAHDFRGPVTAISGYAENLQQIAKDSESRHYSDSILDNVAYINEMITGMLSYMRLENTMTIKKENVELDKLVSQVTDRYMVDFENRNIECEVKGHAVIQADLRLIELLIDNLVMNMAKYAADDSHASIEIDDDQIVFSNKMACAIDCEPSELWEPLKKGNTARTGHTGNGLGLSIVRKIMGLSDLTGEITIQDGNFIVEIVFKK